MSVLGACTSSESLSKAAVCVTASKQFPRRETVPVNRLVQLLRQRPGFRWLWLGGLVSLLGDWLSYVALSLLVIRSGQGAFALAIVFAGHVLPHVVVAPFAGVLADRLDKRRLLIGIELAQALVVATMVAAAIFKWIVAVQVMLFVRTSIGALAYSAKQAAIRELVNEDELVDANAIDAATWSIAFALGTALGGVVALAGVPVALGLDALTFVLGAIVFFALPPLRTQQAETLSLSTTLRRTLRDLAEAAKIAAKEPALLEAMTSKAPAAMGLGGAWLLLNMRGNALGLWGSGAVAIGVLQGIRGLGTGVGPLLGRMALDRGRSAAQLMRSGTWFTLVAMVAFCFSTNWPLLIATVFCWGLGSGTNWVFSCAEVQRLSPDGTVGRMSAFDQICFTLGESCAALGAGLLIDHLAGNAVYGALAAIALGAFSYLGILLLSRSRQRDAAQALRTSTP